VRSLLAALLALGLVGCPPSLGSGRLGLGDDDATDDDDDATDDDDSAFDDDDDDATDDDDSASDDDDSASDDDDDTEPPPFATTYPASDYVELLDLAVGFYGAQRCGDADNWILASNPNGTTCHLEDGLAANLDLTGGWHDAGDFLKFTLTNAWSAYALIKAFDAFPDAFVDADGNGIPDVLDEAKVGTDYLLKATPDASTLVARVGGDQDHGLWVTSPYQSTLSVAEGGGERPVTLGGQADLAGVSAAALAIMANVYEPYDPTYAAECLAHARDVYALGGVRLGTTPDSFYPDDSYVDDMLCGSVELYRATGEPIFLTEAESWNTALSETWWVLGWNNLADPCRHSLHVAGSPDALTYWAPDVAGYLDAVSTEPGVDGLAWFMDWGSLRLALGAAWSSALYYDATGQDTYLSFAMSQLDYAMGTNEHGRSFVVGFGTNPPVRPHHRNAYGVEALDWNLDEPHLHTLWGGLVGGPTREATGTSSPGYEDDVWDYVGNEVTIDYNTGLVGVSAFVVDALGR
jgi:endoglucanase